jgi:hypothetical protein
LRNRRHAHLEKQNYVQDAFDQEQRSEHQRKRCHTEHRVHQQVHAEEEVRNTIGGALDLDNLADRVIKPVFKASGLKWKGWGTHIVAV